MFAQNIQSFVKKPIGKVSMPAKRKRLEMRQNPGGVVFATMGQQK
jgi:hypothetical protein